MSDTAKLPQISGSLIFSQDTDDLNELFASVERQGKSIVFFIFPFPKKPSQADFPVPELPFGVDGFINFSESGEPATPFKFDQRFHAYAATQHSVLVVAAIGNAPTIHKWAQDYFNKSATQPRYKQWMQNAVWIPHEDVRELCGTPEPDDIEKPKTIEHIDLDDTDAVVNAVYGSRDDDDQDNPEFNDPHRLIQ